MRLASAGKRLGGHLLDGLLAVVTLLVGWFIWSLIVYNRGQTPAKQLLKMRVVKLETGTAAAWGTMFVREWIAKLLINLLAAVTVIGYILLFWVTWDAKKQELWDKIVGTIVVNDVSDVVARAP